MKEHHNHPKNPLYPIFLKLHQLDMLIVGAGDVGYEKLFFILKSSPDAQITVVATWISDEVQQLAEQYPQIHLVIKPFEEQDLKGRDLVIAATNIRELHQEIQRLAKKHAILVNVADTPDLCDFYLGSIVTRGPLKIGISTNGQSPTFAKRFRQMLEATLPESTAQLIDQLHEFRDQLKGDFAYKVEQLNKITESLLSEKK